MSKLNQLRNFKDDALREAIDLAPKEELMIQNVLQLPFDYDLYFGESTHPAITALLLNGGMNLSQQLGNLGLSPQDLDDWDKFFSHKLTKANQLAGEEKFLKLGALFYLIDVEFYQGNPLVQPQIDLFNLVMEVIRIEILNTYYKMDF